MSPRTACSEIVNRYVETPDDQTRLKTMTENKTTPFPSNLLFDFGVAVVLGLGGAASGALGSRRDVLFVILLVLLGLDGNRALVGGAGGSLLAGSLRVLGSALVVIVLLERVVINRSRIPVQCYLW